MVLKNLFRILFGLVIYALAGFSYASIIIPMYEVGPNGHGKKLGIVVADETNYGVVFTPNLKGLPPGVHGFHIHENEVCGDDGMAAGGHLDPEKTNKHLGPYNNKGHLGDLPVLIVDAKGKATLPVLAPRLKLADIAGHSLMIHAGGDNYSDVPEKLGGGGMRIVCGSIGKVH